MNKFIKGVFKFVLGTSVAATLVFIIELNQNIQIDYSGITVPYGYNMPANGVLDSIIRLHKDYGFFCSAVVIDANYALTAAHCVTDGWGMMDQTEIVVKDSLGFFTGKRAKPVAIDKWRDVALLKGDFNPFRAAKVNWNGQGLEDMSSYQVVQCGFPSGGDLFCSQGKLTGNYFFQLTSHMTQVYQGMSGGPVYNLSTLEVIGVNSAASSDSNIVAPLIGIRENFGL